MKKTTWAESKRHIPKAKVGPAPSHPRQATRAKPGAPCRGDNQTTNGVMELCLHAASNYPKQASEGQQSLRMGGDASWQAAQQLQTGLAETDLNTSRQYIDPSRRNQPTNQPSNQPANHLTMSVVFHPLQLTMTFSSGGCDPLCTQHASAPRHMSTMKPTPTTGKRRKRSSFFTHANKTKRDTKD